MSKKPPSNDNFLQQMMMMNAMRSQSLAAEQAAYQQNLDAERAQAAANVAAQQALMNKSIKAAIARPVKLGTLMTGSQGLLGNPVLSTTKLSG